MSELETLREAVREELDSLWSDLNIARRDAINGVWSIRCDGLVERIKNLTSLVGATPWEQIQIPLLEDGVYQRIHDEVGIPVEVDMKRVAEVRARIDKR